MPEHVEIAAGEVHIAHNYEYADATAREAATGFVSADLGKIAQQQDNDSYWVLVDTAPIWVRISVGAVVNAQTGTTYTVLAKDRGKLVTHTNGSAIAVTLPQANSTGFGADWFYWVQNRGAGAVTITPTTSTIDGAATLVLNQNEGALIVSDGTNYFTMRGKGSNIVAISTGVSGLGSNVATFLATPSSANLRSALTDETGTGAAVFADTPTLVTPVLGTPTSGNLSNCTADGTNGVGFKNIPQNSQSAAYTTVLGDAGKHILHPSTDANARTFTIDSNANVAYPIGTAITFINMTSQVVTIAITSDTMNLAGTGTTGSRSLAQYGVATAIKIGTTLWIISGTGLT